MDKKNKVWLSAIVLVIAIAAVVVLMQDSSPDNSLVPEPVNDVPAAVPEPVYSDSERGIFEEFLKANISDISPEKEVLGGKFYITNIEWVDENSAIVDYEDGHITLRAEAEISFTDETRQQARLDNFQMLELEEPPLKE